MDPQLATALAMLRRKDADGIKRLLDEQLARYNAKKNIPEQPVKRGQTLFYRNQLSFLQLCFCLFFWNALGQKPALVLR